jgi:hypothetical protein
LSTAKRGIITLANDNYLDWLVALLGSIRTSNPHLPVAVIPYDRDVTHTAQLLSAIGIPLWAPDRLLERCDHLARLLCAGPKWSGAFRRFAAFEGPFDEFLYLDADVIALCGLGGAFDAAASSGKDIVFGDRSPGMAYLAGARRDELLRVGAQEWSNGVFYSRSGRISLDSFVEFVVHASELDKEVLNPDVPDQSFLNWYVALAPLSAAYLPEIAGFPGNWAFSGARERGGQLFRDEPGTVEDGRLVSLLHWAGLPQPHLWMPHATRWLTAYETIPESVRPQRLSR